MPDDCRVLTGDTDGDGSLDSIYHLHFVITGFACYEAFLEPYEPIIRSCVWPDDIPRVENVDFDITLVALLAGPAAHTAGYVVLEKVRVCQGELQVAYHVADCGDLNATSFTLHLVFIPRAGITSFQIEHTEDPDPTDRSECPDPPWGSGQ